MASEKEIRTQQKSLLYDLLRIKKDADDPRKAVLSLIELIKKTEAAMDEEDVAWVEKKIAELDQLKAGN